jgi:hypothetical protein
MSEAVLFDTNTLPRRGGLDAPLWSSIRKLCEAVGVAMLISDIVLQESLNLRRDNYQSASAGFLKYFREVERFFSPQPLYLPSADEICRDWEDELRDVFEILPVHGEDAAEALDREARRIRPAREGRGGRDSAIWLTVLRHVPSYDVFHFVSRNTKDFSSGDDSKVLHPDLEAEVSDIDGELRYHVGVDPFLEGLGTPTDAPLLDVADLAERLGFQLIDAVLEVASRRGDDLVAEQLLPEGITITDADALRSYAVGGVGTLALFQLVGHVAVGHAPDGVKINFSCPAWVTVDDGEGHVMRAEPGQVELA